MTTTEKKINHIYKLLGYLAEGRELYKQDEQLHEELGLTSKGVKKASIERSLYRYLEDIVDLYGHIVKVEKKQKEFNQRKVAVYSVIDKTKDVSTIFKFFLEHSTDMSWLLQLVHENDPTILNESEDKKLLQNALERDKDIFLFVGSPFEKFDEEKSKLFDTAKMVIKNHEYRNIIKHDGEKLEDTKLLKLIHMSNNWYLAIEDREKRSKLLRFSFIKDITYSTKNSYQKKELSKYKSYFENLQNPMTLNKDFKTATFRISKDKAHYFKPDMKPFFPTQKYIKELESGEVEFTINYTQPLEILPFVMQWQPDLVVISPVELKKEIKSTLQKSIANYK